MAKMINGINSYSSYNYTNTFSNNTLNTKSSNVTNDNSSFVSDKSQAVSKILGYGVDKDGFLQVILTKQREFQKIIKFMLMVLKIL
ncbi:hypothetical protein [Helicobacter burdigaliensis]|uniref:hypothetical protein n=1 Tax=Helicobacter burdigaliensis TaxID=2315334 RepID=UPI002FCD9D9F